MFPNLTAGRLTLHDPPKQHALAECGCWATRQKDVPVIAAFKVKPGSVGTGELAFVKFPFALRAETPA
jgi:hypothetical protein